MKLAARTFIVLTLTTVGLSGCGPHLAKLGVCSSGPYRYANAKGVSLPSLSVPTPDDLNAPPPSPPDAGANGSPASPAPPPAPAPAPAPGAAGPAVPPAAGTAPVATPPKRGAMLLPPRGSAPFRSC